MKMNKIIIVLVLLITFFLGANVSQIYSLFLLSDNVSPIKTIEVIKECDKEYDGLFFKNTTSPHFERGDWVCVNTYEMDYPRAYDVCVHECSHQAYSEIF